MMGNWATLPSVRGNPWSVVLIYPEPLCGRDLQLSASKSQEMFLPAVLGKVQRCFMSICPVSSFQHHPSSMFSHQSRSSVAQQGNRPCAANPGSRRGLFQPLNVHRAKGSPCQAMQATSPIRSNFPSDSCHPVCFGLRTGTGGKLASAQRRCETFCHEDLVKRVCM